MKHLFLLIVLLFGQSYFYSIHGQTGFPQNGPEDIRPQYLALVHANIQIDPKTLVQDATIIIKNGKIEAIGKNLFVPKDAQEINLNGKFIYPSFIDAFSNYGIRTPKENKNKAVDQYRNNQAGAYAWNDALHPNQRAATHFDYDEKKSEEYLAAGFGLTLSAVQDGIFRGSAALVLTGKGEPHEIILNSDAAATMSFNKGSSSQDYPGSAMGAVALIRQTYYDADFYSQQKTKSEVNLSFENFSNLKSLPTLFETENKYATLRAAKIAKEFGLTYWFKTNGDDYQRINEIKACKSPLILPLNFPKPYEVEDVFDAEKISLSDLKHWELAPSNPAQVNKAGIPFALTYQGHQNAEEFLKNLRKAVQYGLSQEAALQALTLLPATLLNATQLTGKLEKGLLANFFISDKNIFEKDAIILDHFIKGKRNEIHAWVKAELAGSYQFQLKGFENTLLILSKKKGLEASLQSKDTIKLNFSEKAATFNLSFTLQKNKDQIYRATCWVNEVNANNHATQIKGRVQFPNGTIENLTATFVSAEISSLKSDSSKAIKLGTTLYPFSEYGSEVLPKQEFYCFKNAKVWTNEKEGIIEADVLVKEGKITAVGKDLNANGAILIDAKGKHLTNGIIDEHSHIAIYRGVNECTQNNTAEVRIGDVINADDINIYRQLSGGVIACQQLHGSCNPIGGQSSIIKLRWGKSPEEMKIEGVDGFIKFALGENVKQSNWGIETSRYPQTRMGVEQVYYDAFIRAKAYEQKIKKEPALTRKDLELEALVEILNKKRFISCHSYVQSEINMLMHVGDSMGFKVNTFTHILEGYKVADKMKLHGASASTFADWWAYKYEVIDAIPQNASILNKMGITTAVNSDDAEMGRRLNQEAAKMVKYGGIKEEEAWKMVTLNPAIMLHLDKQTGSIKVGKDADLVLWSDNPLSIYAKAELTLVDGICYYSIEKDKALRNDILLERQRIIQKMILAKQNGEKVEKKVSVDDPDYHCDTVETY